MASLHSVYLQHEGTASIKKMKNWVKPQRRKRPKNRLLISFILSIPKPAVIRIIKLIIGIINLRFNVHKRYLFKKKPI